MNATKLVRDGTLVVDSPPELVDPADPAEGEPAETDMPAAHAARGSGFTTEALPTSSRPRGWPTWVQLTVASDDCSCYVPDVAVPPSLRCTSWTLRTASNSATTRRSAGPPPLPRVGFRGCGSTA